MYDRYLARMRDFRQRLKLQAAPPPSLQIRNMFNNPTLHPRIPRAVNCAQPGENLGRLPPLLVFPPLQHSDPSWLAHDPVPSFRLEKKFDRELFNFERIESHLKIIPNPKTFLKLKSSSENQAGGESGEGTMHSLRLNWIKLILFFLRLLKKEEI